MEEQMVYFRWVLQNWIHLKRLFLPLLLFFTALQIGCSQLQSKNLLGVWVNEEEGIKIIFQADSTFTATGFLKDVDRCQQARRNASFTGRYRIDKDQIVLESDGGQTCEFRMTSNLNFSYKLAIPLMPDVGGFIYLGRAQQ